MRRKLIATAVVAIGLVVTIGMQGRDCSFVVAEEDGVLVPLNPDTKEPLGLFERIDQSVSLNSADGGFRDVTQCLKDMGYGPRLAEVMPYVDQEVTVLSPGSKDVIDPPADIDQTRI